MFRVKRTKSKSTKYISTVHGRAVEPNANWQSDYCVSVGDRETHSHVTFILKDGKLMVYTSIEAEPDNGVDFDTFMAKHKR